MDKIFQTAAEIGCLLPYLESLAVGRNRKVLARDQWINNIYTGHKKKEVSNEQVETP